MYFVDNCLYRSPYLSLISCKVMCCSHCQCEILWMALTHLVWNELGFLRWLLQGGVSIQCYRQNACHVDGAYTQRLLSMKTALRTALKVLEDCVMCMSFPPLHPCTLRRAGAIYQWTEIGKFSTHSISVVFTLGVSYPHPRHSSQWPWAWY